MKMLTKFLQLQLLIVFLRQYIIKVLQQGTQRCLTTDLPEKCTVHKVLAMPRVAACQMLHNGWPGNLP